ncbi:MAG: serine protease, partial [Lachnospira sp.]|nr:serine protease [Lachnospira sp.]
MKRRILSSLLAVVLLMCSLMTAAGCMNRVQAIECTKDIEPRAIEEVSDYTNGNRVATDFAVELFKESITEGKNSLVSPLSVMCALAMTANGADGETLKEMENVFGMPMDELNTYLRSYVKGLPYGDKYKFSVANSIWINDNSGLIPSQDFLQTNVDYYDAMIYKAPFDNQIVKDINNWTSKNTDKMIKKIVESVSPHQVMYLINAVAMDAEWQNVYESDDVRKGAFTLAGGTEKYVDFMYATENTYLSDDYAKGFVKYYKERKYAYVALLPDEDIPVDDYVAKLSGEYVSKLLA